MKIYRYNERTLQYERLHVWIYVLTAVAIMTLMSISRSRDRTEYSETELVVLEDERSAFSEEALLKEIDDCGIRFADIVYAQAVLETGSFKSKIFTESNNLFGMKLARSRNTTAVGENRGHAMYDDWRRSVQDYSLYQSTYLRKIKTEKQYLRFLGENYAEDPSYVSKLTRIMYERRER